MMAGDDDGLQGLSIRIGTTRWRDNTIKRMSLEVDD